MIRTLQIGLVLVGMGLMEWGLGHSVALAQSELVLVYPPTTHQTSADQIFLIGTAGIDGRVMVNGEAIARSPAGHFAPSFPLQVGENTFTLRYGSQEQTVVVTRLANQLPTPEGVSFVTESLTPTVDLARQPGDLICFEAIAPPAATVTVNLDTQTIPLMAQPQAIALPPNYAILTFDNQPSVEAANPQAMLYQGCGSFERTGLLGAPRYHLELAGTSMEQIAPGTIEILDPATIQVAEVTASYGAARTGPSTDYSRLTPLPTGTRARVVGREGDWWQLDYGPWISNSDVTVQIAAVPPRSLIRSVQMRPGRDMPPESPRQRTEIRFPLQTPVPLSVDQDSHTFTLTLYNTTAQTDTILLNDDPLVERLDWTQPQPDRVTYRFSLKTQQQWGYDLRYEGTTLVLTLYHPPQLTGPQPLAGMRILLDPGHGGEELGARGPTGYSEKDVNLAVSLLLRDELERRGAEVMLTRETDVAVSLGDRVNLIQTSAPDLALSIHYNALPDNGDAINTAGIGAFWYNAQAHNLAVFLHHYLVETLNRPSYGVFWNNLALTRPTTAPAVMLELGFMINPTEFEWVIDPVEQAKLAGAIADGIVAWLDSSQPQPSP
ncbi:MAG: N-acetylmuramoyl-L-alanine amidase [Leptolyngbyaceae bacterium]|nr:N-acetylmuramoyl-L-alanine amidase [Leptolyngbyaceae bacterium]